ncbi:MAG: RNA polymerase sigma factor [Planctomycetota bacterium]|jgi:RNA polymerase sigma-70 factor (ECF subfamily)
MSHPDRNVTYRLALRAVDGDMQAMRGLVERIRPRIVGWYRKRMGARLLGRATPEDLAQEALTEIFQRLPTFEPQGQLAFRGWLRRILFSTMADLSRQRTRIPRDNNIHSGIPDAQQDTPSMLVAGRELQRLFKRALKDLPDSHAEILRLRLVEQLSTVETAGRLGITEKNVTVRLTRARAALSEYFAKHR